MMMPNVRVFTPTNMQRLGLQNRVLRQLRAMGCQVLNTALDPRLTIEVKPATAAALLRRSKCIVRQRASSGSDAVVSVEVDGCLVKWTEAKQ